MLAKRIIPCLDVKDGRVVKGVNFVGLRDAGDPVEIAQRYDAEGADELIFLDITASHERRKIILDVVRAHRRDGLHAAHRRRRRARGRRTSATCSTPAPTRSRSTPPRCSNPELRARGRASASAASASWSPSTPSASPTNGDSHGALGGLHPRRPHADRARRGRVGAAHGEPRRRRDPAHQHGPRRHQGGLRHRAHARDRRRGPRSRSSPRAASAPSSTSTRPDRRRRRRRAGRLDLPLHTRQPPSTGSPGFTCFDNTYLCMISTDVPHRRSASVSSAADLGPAGRETASWLVHTSSVSRGR